MHFIWHHWVFFLHFFITHISLCFKLLHFYLLLKDYFSKLKRMWFDFKSYIICAILFVLFFMVIISHIRVIDFREKISKEINLMCPDSESYAD